MTRHLVIPIESPKVDEEPLVPPTLNFNPDQARDEKGQWTSEGAGNSPESAPSNRWKPETWPELERPHISEAVLPSGHSWQLVQSPGMAIPPGQFLAGITPAAQRWDLRLEAPPRPELEAELRRAGFMVAWKEGGLRWHGLSTRIEPTPAEIKGIKAAWRTGYR